MRFTLASAPALLRWQDSIGKRSALRLACEEADGVLYCFIVKEFEYSFNFIERGSAIRCWENFNKAGFGFIYK